MIKRGRLSERLKKEAGESHAADRPARSLAAKGGPDRFQNVLTVLSVYRLKGHWAVVLMVVVKKEEEEGEKTERGWEKPNCSLLLLHTWPDTPGWCC